MTIASEISRLQTAKSCIKASIEAKGVTVGSGVKLDNYSACIDAIEQGGIGQEVEYLLVGGGGGGGGFSCGNYTGGGGGGGAVQYGKVSMASDVQIGVSVGCGGAKGACASGSCCCGGSPGCTSTLYVKKGSSTICTVNALGGGPGQGYMGNKSNNGYATSGGDVGKYGSSSANLCKIGSPVNNVYCGHTGGKGVGIYGCCYSCTSSGGGGGGAAGDACYTKGGQGVNVQSFSGDTQEFGAGGDGGWVSWGGSVATCPGYGSGGGSSSDGRGGIAIIRYPIACKGCYSGGTFMKCYSNYVLHYFTSGGTFTKTPLGGTVKALLVGGGAGGSSGCLGNYDVYGGPGGGGGQVLEYEIPVSGCINVTAIGAGGTGAAQCMTLGTDGGDTCINAGSGVLVAIGGKKGSAWNSGSGGTSGSGYAGGNGTIAYCSNNSGAGGGGGGACGAGATGSAGWNSSTGGKGGLGYLGYGGGGGGGGRSSGGCGCCGGGNGNTNCNATNCGGGGGGTSYGKAGDGGAGIVEICYLANGGCGFTTATGGNCCYSCNGYCVHRFTSSGTFCIVS